MIILKRKKGQSSLEFVLIAAVMFLVFLGMIMVIQSRVAGAQMTRLYNTVEGLGNLIATEVRMAGSAQGYYSREFSLPLVVDNNNYSINIYNKSEIVISISDYNYVIFLDNNVSGSIVKGRNIIRNIKDNISITPLS